MITIESLIARYGFCNWQVQEVIAERDAEIARLTALLAAAQPAKVFMLLDSSERVLSVHPTRESADTQRANYVQPSHITVYEWSLEP
jgi:hypothetical protein